MSVFQSLAESAIEAGIDEKELMQELCEGVHYETYQAEARQKRIDEANRRIERCWRDGLGEPVMSIDTSLFLHWAVLEPGCWQDETFRREFLRDNPGCRVKARSPNTTVQVSGFGGRKVASYG